MGNKSVGVLAKRKKRGVDVILRESIIRGKCGTIVTMSRGYANYNVRYGKAVYATPKNIEQNKHELEILMRQDDERRKLAEKHAEVLKGTLVCFVRSAGAQGKLYGSVSVGDLVSALQNECSVVVLKNQISMTTARTTGEHCAKLYLFEGVNVDLKFYVVESDEAKAKLISEKKKSVETAKA